MLKKGIRDALVTWRAWELVEDMGYGSSTALMTGETLMPDTVIDQLATCGERILDGNNLAR